jgi:hypothetical protein
MANSGCLFFFRAGWRVSSKLPSRKKGSSSNMAALLFILTKTRSRFYISIPQEIKGQDSAKGEDSRNGTREEKIEKSKEIRGFPSKSIL